MIVNNFSFFILNKFQKKLKEMIELNKQIIFFFERDHDSKNDSIVYL